MEFKEISSVWHLNAVDLDIFEVSIQVTACFIALSARVGGTHGLAAYFMICVQPFEVIEADRVISFPTAKHREQLVSAVNRAEPTRI